MLEIIAIALIILGLYMVIRGLTESYDYRYEYRPYEWRYEEERENERLKEREELEPKRKKVDVKGGGVVLIGPIPIVFGESRFAVYALILAIVLMLLSIFFMLSVQVGT